MLRAVKVPQAVYSKNGMIKLSGLLPEQTSQIKSELTFNNPAYESTMRYSRWATTNVPPYLTYYRQVDDSTLYVPIGYDIESLRSRVIGDERILSPAKFPPFVLTLRPDQQSAADAFIEQNKSPILKGNIQMPTAKGKSILGLYLSHFLSQKTLIVVHKDDLVSGWKADIELAFAGKIKSGLIKAKSRKIGEQITIATIQTLNNFSEEELLPLLQTFGFVIQDECFPKGALVDGKDISTLKVGDLVRTYNETKGIIELKPIIHVFKSVPKNILKIKLNNGKEIFCTENHPFYVRGGYTPAVELKNGDELYNLLEGDTEPHKASERLSQIKGKGILLNRVLQYLQKQGKFRNNVKNKQEVCFSAHEREQSHVQEECSGESILIRKRETFPCEPWWKRERSDRTSKNPSGLFKRFAPFRRICSKNRSSLPLSPLLFDRHSLAGQTRSNRDRWPESQRIENKGERLNKRFRSNTVRVESVEIQEQTSDGTFNGVCSDGFVYNIETEHNHNYFVNGILVHNCHHIAATSFSLTSRFNSRYKLGLTATPERSDGLTHVIKLYFGDFCYTHIYNLNDNDILPILVNVRSLPAVYFNPVCKITRNGGYTVSNKTAPKEYILKEGERRISDIPYNLRPKVFYSTIDRYAVSQILLGNVVPDVVSEFNEGHSCIVFFKQKEDCEACYALLRNRIGEENVYLYYGNNKDNESVRERAENHRKMVTITTYAKSTEGTNVTRWEVAFLVSSIKDGKNVEQAVGRIRRTRKDGDKLRVARVYDYRTPNVYTFASHGRSRDARYQKLMGGAVPPTPAVSLFGRGFSR